MEDNICLHRKCGVTVIGIPMPHKRSKDAFMQILPCAGNLSKFARGMLAVVQP